WNPASEEHGHHRHLHAIDKASLQQAAKKHSTAEEPDVLARLLFEPSDGSFEIITDYADSRVVGGAQCPRDHDRLHAGSHLPRSGLRHFKRTAAHKCGIEAAHQGPKVDLRVHDNPVIFT